MAFGYVGRRALSPGPRQDNRPGMLPLANVYVCVHILLSRILHRHFDSAFFLSVPSTNAKPHTNSILSARPRTHFIARLFARLYGYFILVSATYCSMYSLVMRLGIAPFVNQMQCGQYWATMFTTKWTHWLVNCMRPSTGGQQNWRITPLYTGTQAHIPHPVRVPVPPCICLRSAHILYVWHTIRFKVKYMFNICMRCLCVWHYHPE